MVKLCFGVFYQQSRTCSVLGLLHPETVSTKSLRTSLAMTYRK